jgi:hypothetical protein
MSCSSIGAVEGRSIATEVRTVRELQRRPAARLRNALRALHKKGLSNLKHRYPSSCNGWVRCSANRLHCASVTPVLYDRNEYYGGHTHPSAMKQDLFADSVDQQYIGADQLE